MSTTEEEARDHAAWDAVDEATELLREGAYEEALAELRSVLERDPGNHYAHYFLGTAHFELEQWEPARAAYEEAARLAPTYRGAVLGMGHALRMLGRLHDALRAGERALAMKGQRPTEGDPDAHYLLGLCHAQRGDKPSALRHLREFLRANPEAELRAEVEGLVAQLEGRKPTVVR